MTDKQIIINGVDISKCKHYDEVFNYCDQSYLGEGGLLKNTKNPKRCDCSPNCYYKQLKRKEQECEKLKKARRLVETSRDKWEYIAKNKERECQDLQDISIKKYPKCGEVYLNSIGIKVFDQLTQLKAQLLDQEAETLKAGGIIETLTKENEQLKKQACGLRPELKYIINKTCCKYNINAKYYHEKIVEIINNLDKYVQILTEIKGLAENMNKECFYDDFDCMNCDMQNGCTYFNKKQILQKISEVIK